MEIKFIAREGDVQNVDEKDFCFKKLEKKCFCCWQYLQCATIVEETSDIYLSSGIIKEIGNGQ